LSPRADGLEFKIGIGLHWQNYDDFQNFSRCKESAAVEIYEKTYVIFELARPARGGHATNIMLAKNIGKAKKL